MNNNWNKNETKKKNQKALSFCCLRPTKVEEAPASQAGSVKFTLGTSKPSREHSSWTSRQSCILQEAETNVGDSQGSSGDFRGLPGLIRLPPLWGGSLGTLD